MRHTSLLLGGLLSTLAFAIQAQSHDHDHHGHGDHDQKHASTASLDAHEHGVASLNLVVDGGQLIIELDSPAANIVGFEHMPGSAEDFAALADARKQLLRADALFAITDAAGCALEEAEAKSPLSTPARLMQNMAMRITVVPTRTSRPASITTAPIRMRSSKSK